MRSDADGAVGLGISSEGDVRMSSGELAEVKARYEHARTECRQAKAQLRVTEHKVRELVEATLEFCQAQAAMAASICGEPFFDHQVTFHCTLDIGHVGVHQDGHAAWFGMIAFPPISRELYLPPIHSRFTE